MSPLPGDFLIPLNPSLVHLLFETLAFIAGYRYYIYLRRDYADVIPSSTRLSILIGAAAGAFLFSRILGALENPTLISQSFVEAFNNRTIVGGLLGGLLGVEVVKKLVGERHSSGDLFAYPIILAMIIGRLGCFFAGMSDNTVGNATSLPWGIDFGDGISRHPTNLYEIAFLICLWLILKKVSKEALLQNGSIFKLFMIGYLLFRFLVDFMKPYPATLAGLNSIQVACLLGLMYYFRYIAQPKLLLKPSNA